MIGVVVRASEWGIAFRKTPLPLTAVPSRYVA